MNRENVSVEKANTHTTEYKTKEESHSKLLIVTQHSKS